MPKAGSRRHGQQFHHHHHQQQHNAGNLRQILPLPIFLLLLLPILPILMAPAAEARQQVSDDDLLLLPLSHTASHGRRGVTLSYLRRTLQALGDALGFFHSQHTQVNLDGVIGTRIVEGTLKVLLSNLRRKGQMAVLPVDIATDIQSVHDLASLVSDESEPYVAINEPQYFNRVGQTIRAGMWELDYSMRNLSASVASWPFRSQEAMQWGDSDDCLTELFGTSGKTKKTCAISDSCWGEMTKMGYHLYSLSHQIYYLQLGELSGCLPEIQQRTQNSNQPSLRELQDTFCANMLRETQHLAHLGYPANFRDLLMEQAGLCGMYGYWELFRYSWLDKILSWQNREAGCYQNDAWPGYVDEHRRRVKRDEVQLDNGCLSHMTAVASLALVQYARYLTEAFFSTIDD